MSATYWIVAGAVGAGLLVWVLRNLLANDKLDRITRKRKRSSLLASRAELVDGNRHVPVAIALTDSGFFYESSDIEGSLDLDRIAEVEYENELATGQDVIDGRVLRLRSSSQSWEFVLRPEAVTEWQTALPAKRMH